MESVQVNALEICSGNLTITVPDVVYIMNIVQPLTIYLSSAMEATRFLHEQSLNSNVISFKENDFYRFEVPFFIE